MKKNAFTFLLVLVNIITQAQAPANYYDNATGKAGDELKIALHDIIDGHTSITYQQIWSAFWSTDNKGNNVVWDMYSDGANYTYSYYNGDQCGEYTQEGDCYNREHSWPQSWFNNASTPTTDLHHIFPTDGFVNSQRSNYPFGEVQSTSWTSQNGSKLGTCKSSLGYTGTVFEPIDEYKGDFARAIMYMSVRYYGEDSSWVTSGMTNKSVIKDWAITMLMNWSDNDPVSQKEIDRNEVVYGIQGNRNPFIDHPEYARAIWDPDWTGVVFNISYASVQHGSISGPATAVEGTLVTPNATPTEGYMIGNWSVYKTGDTSTIVTVNNDGTFTMPAYAVTVSATFVENATNYAITKSPVSHGSITVSANSAQSGATITLSAIPDNGYSLYAWYVFKTGDMNTTIEVNGNSFTMPAFDVTVIATFVEGGNGNYVKVTSAPSDWSGDYLIVYESGNKAFDGGLETLDAVGNTVSVTTNNSTILANNTTNAAKFTIAAVSGGYSIQSASGYYIGQTSNDNGLKSSKTTAYVNILTYNGGNIDIIGSGGPYLRYNANTGQERFRYFKSSTYTSQQAIQLFKKTSSSSTPTHTIQFNPNGSSQSSYSQTVNEFEATALQPNTFTREGYEFDSWNTAADGTGTTFFDCSTVRLLENLTLFAQWKQVFTITLEDSSHGSVTASQTQAVEGITITLTANPDEDYALDHWTVTYNNGDNTIDVEENQFEMPAANVTVSATFVFVGNPFIQQYQLVTSTNQLEAGKTYLIVNTNAGKALSKTQNNNNRAATAVTINNGLITEISDAVCEITLGESNEKWTFYDASNSGYLCAASSSSNLLKTQSKLDNDGRWTIAIASNGSATIIAQGTNDRNNLRFNPNNGTPIFSCYVSSSTMSKVELYVRTETFVMDIEGYTENGGWYTIATPFADFAPAQIAKGNYDLYAYDEDSEQEWINYKANPAGFPTSASSGYLYAHNPGTTLQITGTPNDNNYSETVILSYANSDTNLKGFNLLGNPTAHNITYTTSGSVSDGYYYLFNSETWLYEPGNSVPVGRGFLVKANASGQSVTLNPQSRGDHAEATFLCVTIDDDKAYVKMDEGVSMPLLNFQGKSSSVYLTRDSKPYIMLTKGDANAIDVCYKPNNNGEHTLTVSATTNSKLSTPNYLHLIDHRTGADVDLIANPSYRFESNNSDYASRFQLRFSDDIDTDSDLFAYYADRRIVVNAEGTLQIHDITGRKVENGNLATGVYVLRLITPEKVRVQKIIID